MTPLEESIEHWKRLVSGNRNKYEEFGSNDCALCQAYLNWNKPGTQICAGCPVMEATGQTLCHGSPFDIIRDLDMEWRNGNHNEDEELMDTPDFKEAAQKELDFLKSLLP